MPSHKSESGKSPTVRKQRCLRAFVRADAAMRRRFSYGSELSAGAAFVLAGFSSGTGVCARGGTGVIRNSECGTGARDERIRLSGSVAEFCRWFMSAFTVLPRRFPRRMLVIAVLPRHLSSVYPFLCGAVEAISSARVWLCGSVGASCLRFTPAVCRMATNRTACDTLRFYSAGSRSPFVRSRGVNAVICLGAFTSGLAVSLWRSRRVTGDAGTGERGWRRGACALCAIALAL